MKNINFNYSKIIYALFLFSFSFDNFLTGEELREDNQNNELTNENEAEIFEEAENEDFLIEEKIKNSVATVFASTKINDLLFDNPFLHFEKRPPQIIFNGILVDKRGYVAVPFSAMETILQNNFHNIFFNLVVLINGKEYPGILEKTTNQSISFIKIDFKNEKPNSVINLNQNYNIKIGNEVIKKKLINLKNKNFISSETSKVISNLENFYGKRCLLLSSQKNEFEIGAPIFNSRNNSIIGILDELNDGFGKKIETMIPLSVIKKYFEIEILHKESPKIGLSFNFKITPQKKELVVSSVSETIKDIKINDKILKINGEEIFSNDDVSYAILDLKFEDFVEVEYFSELENKIKITKIILEKNNNMNKKMISSFLGSFLVANFKNQNNEINNNELLVKIIKTQNNCGLNSGDIILKINNEKIYNIDSFEEKIKKIINENYSIIFSRAGIIYESKKEENTGNSFSFFGPILSEELLEDKELFEKIENYENYGDKENYEI